MVKLCIESFLAIHSVDISLDPESGSFRISGPCEVRIRNNSLLQSTEADRANSRLEFSVEPPL